MYPGALIANVYEFKKVGIQACFLANISKERFMSSGGTGCDDDSVQVIIVNCLLDREESRL
jgi:hypothetical protein